MMDNFTDTIPWIDTIQCGDSRELLKRLPDGSVDLTVTSPPYDNLRKYNGFDISEEYCKMSIDRIEEAKKEAQS